MDDITRRRLAAIERELNDLRGNGDINRKIRDIERDIHSLMGGRVHGNSGECENPDHPWKCAKCASILAMYDPSVDVLRVRHRDFYMYVKVGLGGFIEIICRACGESNVQQYTDEPAQQVAGDARAG